MRRRREVTLLGPSRQPWSGGAHHDAPPGAVTARIARSVTDRVLTRQLVRDLAVDVRELRRLCREERAPACFLELTQHELGFLEALGACRRPLARPEAD